MDGWGHRPSAGPPGGVGLKAGDRGGTDLDYGRRTARVYEPFMAAVTLGQYRSFVAREVARLGLRPGDRLLDLACGTGLVLHQAARRLGPRGEAVGVDNSAAMLEQAARREPPTDSPVTYIRAEADALPLADSSFDWVTLFLGLHEIAPAARLPALREVRRVLRPGGRGLILDFASGGSPLRRGLTRLALTTLEGPEAWTITDPGVPALVEAVGLSPGQPRPAFLGLLALTAFTRR